ncbi:MAG: hypothetical protein B7Y39_08495 [Bdellovibrio sp. 28-41-41]|nr:MAG: hypothetical protein B7Y39_08495 [Bdellovibrio sp. 28-41-41]
MLATIVSDKFLIDERELIANALDEICSPNDNWGWASTGIYCFWNPSNTQILYIGLAQDIPKRFREHVGIIQCNPMGCKKTQIDEYFKTSSILGYSVLLQSCFEQAGLSALGMLLPELGDTGVKNIKTNEGLLIEAYRLQYGRLPDWNKISGNRSGSKVATPQHEPILKFLSDVDVPNPFRAELPLRSLAQAGGITVTEELELHLIRMFALGGHTLQQALEIHRTMQSKNPYSSETLDRPNCKKWISKWCRR